MFNIHRTKKRCGFTLVEVTIVVLLMSIIAAVAAPTYVSALNNYRADMAARKLVADLQYARSDAQRKSTNRTVSFSLPENRYELAAISDLKKSTNTYRVDLVDAPFHATLMSVSFAGNSFVVFDMHGHPSSPGSVVLKSGTTQKTIAMADDGTLSIL